MTPIEHAGDIVFVSMNNREAVPDLDAFVDPQFAYALASGVADPGLYVFEALGVALALNSVRFENQYGASGHIVFSAPDEGSVDLQPHYPALAYYDAAFIADAYARVFGREADAAQIDHFVTQVDYFETIYAGTDTPENVTTIARGAIYGQMLGFEAAAYPDFIGVPTPFWDSRYP